MTRALEISPRAVADLLEIWSYTHDRWGPEQADRYLHQIDAGIRWCGRRPQDGVDRERVRAGYRSRLAGRHVIYYTYSVDAVVVRRVLHSRMDAGGHV